MGVLTVTLQKVSHLRDADGIGKSDPYVRFSLRQDNLVMDKNFGKMESSKKANTLNPVYNETFTFHSVPNLHKMKLDVTIMDDDIGLDDKIGSVEINLEHALLTTTPKDFIHVVDKKRFKLFAKEATIHLALSFQP